MADLEKPKESVFKRLTSTRWPRTDSTSDSHVTPTTRRWSSHPRSLGLDIYADEPRLKRRERSDVILKIISKNAEIKDILETLFFDILNIDFNVWSWVRNLCKYGDFVLFVDADERTAS
jgi:hypothetical protein